MRARPSRSSPRGALALALAICSLVATGGAPQHASASTAQPSRAIVQMYGDSELFQAWPYLLGAFDLSSTDLRVSAISGTALCDVLGRISALTAASAPAVVVLQFYGNTYSACMRPHAGTTSSVVAKYAQDLAGALEHLRGIGVRTVLVDVGPVAARPSALRAALITAFKRVLADAHLPGYRYLDAADYAVEFPGGSYARLLPCLPIELAVARCTGPLLAGTRAVVVRASDGVHFCPDAVYRGAGRIEMCDAYASGAYRFAMAFARAVWRALPRTRVEVATLPVVTAVVRTGREVGSMTEVRVSGHHLDQVRAAHFALVREVTPIAYRITMSNGAVESIASPAELLALVPTAAVARLDANSAGFLLALTRRTQSVYLGLAQASLAPR